ncbi:MAG: WD40 repeat domain-containing protein [Planctomycetes bacterium]|nr:WD40 repeat domain-containing protein [Planctomycetota bacterium]
MLALIVAVVLFLNRSADGERTPSPVVPARGVPADQLKAEDIVDADKSLAGGGDPGKMSQYLVAVLHSDTATVPKRSIGKGVPSVLQIGISADGKTLTSLDGRDVAVWDLSTGKELSRFSELLPKNLPAEFAVDLNTTGNLLAWNDGNDNVAFFDLANPKKGTILMPNPTKGTIKALGFSPDSDLFWMVQHLNKSSIRLFKTQTKQSFSSAGPSVSAEAIDVSPDNKTLISASSKGRVILYPLPFVKVKGVKPRTLSVDGTCTFLKFAPDARELVTVTSPGYHFTLWDLPNDKEIHQFGGHSRRIRTVAFNADGKVIASAGDDNFIKVFDRITRQELHHIAVGPKGMEIHQLLFTPEGTHLAAATNLGHVFIFRLPLPQASRPNLEIAKDTKPPEVK